MGLFEDLKARGLVFQTTSDEHFEAWLSERPRTLYCGSIQRPTVCTSAR